MVHTFWRVLIWGKNEKYGEKKKEKKAVFPGGYGRIGQIPHEQLLPDWGLNV